MNELTCRLADANDVDLLFKWANDADVRTNSFSTDPIPYDIHVKWFSNILIDNKTEIYIFSLNEKPLGQIRLKYEETNVLLSYSISREFRGQGLGKKIIREIEPILRKKHHEAKVITAEVKPSNIASRKIFEKNNYIQINSNDEKIVYQKSLW